MLSSIYPEAIWNMRCCPAFIQKQSGIRNVVKRLPRSNLEYAMLFVVYIEALENRRCCPAFTQKQSGIYDVVRSLLISTWE